MRCSAASPARCRSPSTRVIPVLIVYGAFAFAERVRNWERGGPDRRRTTPKNVKRRLADFRAGVYMQTLLRDPAAGIMHSLIYFSFLVLLAVTTVLEIDHQLPESCKFLHGEVYQALLVRRRRRRRRLPRRHRLGDRAPLRAAALPHPHQDQARARRHPRHVPRASASPASSPRRSASPRSDRPDFEKWSFIGYPLVHARRRDWRHHARRLAPDHVDRPRRRVLRLPRRSCPSRCCATCSRRR